MAKFLRTVLLSILFILVSASTVHAEDTLSLPVSGTYDQSGARSLLELVNNERAKIEGLSALSYDQELENAAMTRAMELSVCFNGSTRLDGTKWQTVLTNTSHASQLTAYGQSTPEAVLNAWMNGATNKAALLGSNYQYLGASHVTREGTTFWVIILRKDAGTADEKPAVNGIKSPRLNMTKNKVMSEIIPASSFTIGYGDTYDLSYLREQCSYAGAYSCNKKWSYSISGSISIGDDNIISITDKVITGIKTGYTSIAVERKTTGEKCVLPVTVTKKEITSNEINLDSQNYTFTGKEITPTVTVTVGEKKLTEGVDFVMVFKNNINVSSKGGYVTVTGLDNYDGTATKYFMIEAADISLGTLTLKNEKLLYTGKPIIPEYIVTFNKETLKEDSDYVCKLSDNTNVGTANLTVYGIGNYKGKITGTFTIYTEQKPSDTPSSDTPSSASEQVPSTDPATTEEDNKTKTNEIISTSIKKTKIVSATASKNKISVRWKKTSKIDGYEIQYSTSKKFEPSKTVSKKYKKSKSKAVIKKLKSNKTYYVRMRSFKKSANNIICSSWSKTIKIRIK
ncbi:CAP domain-containing protein [Butyrivibrio sp. AE3004]|uniref:CAP domain-containing protein n=1 Tax=Butyrivibrio sp. AE3004 TaxID=1506994 RepID=UPI00068D07D6|nr:CAP domain-containing protein [Butyrivibrio sp. AE3004]